MISIKPLDLRVSSRADGIKRVPTLIGEVALLGDDGAVIAHKCIGMTLDRSPRLTDQESLADIVRNSPQMMAKLEASCGSRSH